MLYRSSALLLFLIVAIVPVSASHLIEANDVRPIKGPALTGPNSVQSPSGSPTDIEKLIGNYRLIVILVEFSDYKHKTSRDTINNLIFTKMNKYWREVSYNQLNVIDDTVGWINIGHDEAYYGKDTDPKTPGSDQKGRELIADSCSQATNVDFNKYQDIMVIFAGHGQDSDPKNTNLIWAHAYISGLDVTCGTKSFNNGAWDSELVEESGLDLGTIAHEFGHTIGLPDLYNTASDAPDYWKTGIDYVGLWSLMAAGNWAGYSESLGSNPTGLESWSRIKLGWLSALTIPLTEDGFVQTLNELEDASGPRALKLSTSDNSYYLIENRARTGIDTYLPASGVLITGIDESKESGEGIVKVIPCNAKATSIEHAVCNVNDSWTDSSSNIYMKVLKKQGTSYTIAFATKLITTTKDMYTAELSLTNLPSTASANPTIDGTEYGTVSIPETHKLTLTFLGLTGSTHTVTFSQCILTSEDTRSCTNNNVVTISKRGTYDIDYDITQFMLLIQTELSSVPGGDERWFTAGQTENLGPYDETVPVDGDTRYMLLELAVDGTTAGEKSLTLTMDRPHIVAARYVTQYLLKMVTDYGDPKGEGWYNSGDIATYSVTTPYGFLIQRVLVSWAGDVTSSEPQGTLTMTRPYTMEARWRDDYTQIVLASVLIAVLIAAILATKRLKRPSSSLPILTSEAPQIVTVAPTESCPERGAEFP